MSDAFCPHGLLVPPPVWPEGSFTRYCRVCFLQRQTGLLEPAARSLPCIHLGPILSRLGCDCPARWVRGCAIHRVCTLNQCKTCADYEEG